MTAKVTIVDYESGNIFSVASALRQCGAEPIISADPTTIARAERLIIPGVGAFHEAMRRLRAKGLVDAIRSFGVSGRPYLGICLGMQLLLEESEEFGLCQGLGLFKGRVVPVLNVDTLGRRLKIPQIGWNRLIPSEGSTALPDLLQPSNRASDVYFVHSFMAVPEQAARVADCVYGGHRVCAAIQSDAGWGMQFHPEKSGEYGLGILRNFLSI
ncbi:Imidazole glycerol phosphate synthase subunit hisH 1 [Magnetospirillum gryphiswaldense MSR-1 v2]|uniref:Imidazole glycerol phosphate synthase subunit HisH n=1 Tax=Magnetospirillum gryphiswaldense (strain DSM 6361 / JCM 21280 / NBRC 15271 / MSR-1) TaxID=431944 RepID=V6F816_MAGGM|nr:imidazole glycerol phosphate synthase subunit HisH [Magnetospirillum gryphiswaldense]CDL00633.1 Imidazole glycerol phosphate synthase subunit hisH 1 [Magnetospirillum gryphiswaldense MSR-1 v2]